VANTEQRENWNGMSGDAWVRTQEQHDIMLEPWARVLAGTAAVERGEHVLDVGCGCGATTLDAAGRCGPTGRAVGVDLSEAMLARARERATEGGLDNTRFVVGDAQVDDLTEDGVPYDVVISRFGVMFFDDPVAAFANMAAATRPGGRLAMVVWTPMPDQEWLVVPAAAAMQHLGGFSEVVGNEDVPGMFGLASPDRIGEVLGAAGWSDVGTEQHRRRFAISGRGGLDDAVTFLRESGQGRAMFADADPDAAQRAVEAIRASLEPYVTPNGVEMAGSVWAVTARR
jgi:SAM-dependent methyltransferase